MKIVKTDAGVMSTDKKGKLVKWLLPLNVIVISVLLCLLILKIYDKTHSQQINSESVSESEALDAKIDDSMSDLYMSTLSGWTYKLDKKTSFSFGKTGTYAGFFDKDNKDIKGGKYDVTVDEKTGDHMLNIEYKGNTVSYIINLEEGNILLQFPGADKPFVLTTEQSELYKEE